MEALSLNSIVVGAGFKNKRKTEYSQIGAEDNYLTAIAPGKYYLRTLIIKTIFYRKKWNKLLQRPLLQVYFQ